MPVKQRTRGAHARGGKIKSRESFPKRNSNESACSLPNIVMTAVCIILTAFNFNFIPMETLNLRTIPHLRKFQETVAEPPFQKFGTVESIPTEKFGTIETIPSERIEEVKRLVEGKENIALGKVAEQSSIGNGEMPKSGNDGVDCGCPITCTEEALAARVGGLRFTCSTRINYLIKKYKVPRGEACASASEGERSSCGEMACHPGRCPKKEGTAYPQKAVDGNTDQLYSSGSVAATNYEKNPWWQVNLGAVHIIEKIVIYNRMDSLSKSLKKFYVEVLNLNANGTLETVGEVFSEEEAGAVSVVNLGKRATGLLVRIRIDGKAILNFSEVQVYGKVVG